MMMVGFVLFVSLLIYETVGVFVFQIIRAKVEG
jgi:hypothetical protein